MAGKIRKDDIASGDLSQPFIDLNATLTTTVDKINLLLKAGIDLDKSLKNTGTTTKTLNEQQKKSRENTDVLTQRTKALNDIEVKMAKTLGQLSASRTKEGKSLQKLQAYKQAELRQSKLNRIAKEAEAGSYNKISAALSKNLIKYKSLSAAERESTTAGKGLEKTIIKQRSELTKLDAKLGNHTRNVGNYKSALAGTARNLLGAFGVVGGLTMFAKVLTSSVKSVVQMEKSLSGLKAVTGLTDEGMSDLRENAMKLGRETSKTAAEVVGLQTEFAKFGLTKKEILDVTKATVQLSIATGKDLSNSATIAASTLKQFGKDTSQTKAVIDVMAKSFVSSALDIDKFQTGMSQVGTVARNAGLSFEQATASLGILADSGVDASTAGTAFRGILLDLNKHGLTLEGALEKINTSTNKNATAFELFGKRGATVATILAENSGRVDTLTTKLEGSKGAVDKMARAMEDNLVGAGKRLSSAFDGIVQVIGETDGGLQNLIDGFAGFLNKVATFVKTPVSKKLEESYLGFQRLTGALLATEQGTEDYKRIADDLNEQYPNYIKNIDLEGLSYEEIKIQLEGVNKQFEKRIRLAALEEILAKNLARSVELEKERYETQKKSSSEAFKYFGDAAKNMTVEEKLQKLRELATESSTKMNASDIMANSTRAQGNVQLLSAIASQERIVAINKEVNGLQDEYNSLLGEQKTLGGGDAVVEDEGKKVDAKKTTSKETETLTKKEIAENAAKLKTLKAANDKFETDKLYTYDIYAEDWRDGQKSDTDFFIDELDKRNKAKKDSLDAQKAQEDQAREDIKNASLDLTNELFNIASSFRDRNISKLEESKETELATLSDSLATQLAQTEGNEAAQTAIKASNDAAKLDIETKYNKKIVEERRKQAIADKVQGIFNATINTAMGVSKALSSSVPPLNFILAALVGGIGAAQIATIAAQPIPAFAKGGVNKEGGLSLVGEKGSELVQMGGKSYLTPDSATFTYLQPGAVITPAMETQKLLANNEMNRGGYERNKELTELKSISRKLDTSARWTKDGILELNKRTGSTNKRIDIWFR